MALRLQFNDQTRVLRAGQLFAGRSPDSHILLAEEGASRRHAVFTMGKSGAFVSDLSSGMGVFLNGESITQTTQLKAGDTLYIAGLWITVEEAEVDDDDEPTDPRLRSTMSPPAMGDAAVPRLPATPPFGLQLLAASLQRDTLVGDEDDDNPLFASTMDAPSAATALDYAPRPTDPAPPDMDDTDIDLADTAPHLGEAARHLADTAPQPAAAARPAVERAPHLAETVTNLAALAARLHETAPQSATATPRPADSQPRPDSQARPADSTPRPDSQARPDSGPRSQRTPALPEADLSRVDKYAPLPSFSRGESLRALAVMGEKALAVGRVEEAERIMQRGLLDVQDGVRRREVTVETVELAAGLAAKLAAASGAGRWFDYVVSLYAELGELAPGPVVDLLYAAVPKVKSIQKSALKAYVAGLKSGPSDSPARRFLLQRIEGLKRVVELK